MREPARPQGRRACSARNVAGESPGRCARGVLRGRVPGHQLSICGETRAMTRQGRDMDGQSRTPKIEFQKVSKTFGTPGGKVEAVREIDLKIAENEIVCFVGPSGCGKSTLVNLAAGFLLPTEGQVLTDGRPVTQPGPDRAVVFQQDSVFPWLTVAKNLEYGLKARGIDERTRRATVEHLLDLVDLRHFKDMYPRHLSGGMKKRVDLARAYANEPEILLMDEPFGALDVLTKEKMQKDLVRLWRQDAR